jgi:hypothetical protein
MKDLIHDIQVAQLMDPTDITNHTDVASKYVDLKSWNSAVLAVNYGTLTNVDASNKVIAVLQECDASPTLDASWTDVAAGDMFGAFSAVDSTDKDNTIQKVGYKGLKRYLRVKLDFTSAGTNPDHCPVGVSAILGDPWTKPVGAATTGASAGS